jgi:hypothetical protein
MEAPVFCFVNIWMTIFFVWGPSPSLCVPDIKSWTFGDEKKCVVSLILVKRVSKSFFVQGIKLFKIVGVECSNIWRGRVGHFWRSHLLQPLEKWKSRSFWRSSRYFYIKKNCSKIWNFKIKYHRCPKSQQVEKLSQFWSWRTWQNGESSCHNESRIVSDGWISNVGRGCSSFDKKNLKTITSIKKLDQCPMRFIHSSSHNKLLYVSKVASSGVAFWQYCCLFSPPRPGCTWGWWSRACGSNTNLNSLYL